MGAFADVKLNLAQRGRAVTLTGDILDDPLAAAYELIWRRDVIQADRDRLRAAMLPFAHLELATHYADALPIGLLVGAKAEYPHVTARQLRELHAAYRASQDEA